MVSNSLYPIDISNDKSRDYAPVLFVELPNPGKSNQLSKKDLLEVSQNISLYYAPKISSGFKKIVVLPIDPEHIYVYWNLGDAQDIALSQHISNKELSLRIYSESVEKKESVSLKPVIEFDINALQTGKKISLPTTVQNSTVFSVCIGQADSNNTFIPLMISSHTPVVQEKPDQKMNIESKLGSANFIFTKIIENHMVEGGLYDDLKSAKAHFSSTNYSGKGKKR